MKKVDRYPETLKVRVLKKHINQGEMGECGRCPIALALKDMGYKPVVLGDLIEFKRAKAMYNLPLVARTFINKFDAEKSVKPFDFVAEKQELPVWLKRGDVK